MSSANNTKGIFHKLAIMLSTEASGKVFIFTESAKPFLFGVFKDVLCVIRKKFKIFYIIIKSISIFVVNNFNRIKVPTQKFLHHKSMFPYISKIISKWVRVIEYKLIAVPNKKSSLPRGVFGSFLTEFSETIRTVTSLVSSSFLSFTNKDPLLATTFAIFNYTHGSILPQGKGACHK
jgi:hypothetical protein